MAAIGKTHFLEAYLYLVRILFVTPPGPSVKSWMDKGETKRDERKGKCGNRGLERKKIKGIVFGACKMKDEKI